LPIIKVGDYNIIVGHTIANWFTFKGKTPNYRIVNKRDSHFYYGKTVEPIKDEKSYAYVNLTSKYKDEARVKDFIITYYAITSKSDTFSDIKICDKNISKLRLKDFEKMYANMTTTVAQNGEYKYTNESLNEQIINTVSQTQQGYSDKLVNDLKATLKVNLDKFVKIANKAKAAGIKADPDLVGVDQLRDYSQKYYNHLIDTYKPDDAALQAKFNAKKDSYSIPNSIGGYVIGEEYQAGENDFQVAKKQALDIMKTTTKDNFAAKAKEFSKDPGSANNGGSLGETADLSQLVPEFANAVKKSKAGDIVGPIKTQFGYHIIYIQSKDTKNENVAKVSHILITPTISEASKQEVIKKVQALKAEIESKKTTFENVEKQDKYKFSIKERFKKMVKSDAIPGIGKNDELMNQIFALQINGILDRNDATGYYLITKTSEIPFTQATFENSKERVRLELAHEYADKQLEIM